MKIVRFRGISAPFENNDNDILIIILVGATYSEATIYYIMIEKHKTDFYNFT